MKIQKLIPMIYTDNIDDTIKFYKNELGFDCVDYEKGCGWANIRYNTTEIMISKPNELLEFKKPIFTGSFYFKIQNANKLWNRLKDRTRISYPIQDFDYGMREFAIYDNNGYMLQFGQEID